MAGNLGRSLIARGAANGGFASKSRGVQECPGKHQRSSKCRLAWKSTCMPVQPTGLQAARDRLSPRDCEARRYAPRVASCGSGADKRNLACAKTSRVKKAVRMSAESSPRSATSRDVSFWRSVTWATLLLAGAISMFDPLDLFSYSVTPVGCTTAEHVAPSDRPNVATTPHGASATTGEEAARLLDINDRMPHNSDLREHEARACARLCYPTSNLKKSLVGLTAVRHI
jgi:hypothetical protein